MKAAKPLVIAHRGASAEAPENSLAAFMLGVKQECDMIELDVHLTKDKQVVVIHDHTLDRTTNGVGEIANLHYEDMKGYDCGNWFSDQYAGEYVPLLEEVLTKVPANVQFNVEIKAAGTPGMVSGLMDVLSKTDRIGSTVVSSFHYGCLAELKKQLPDIRIGLLYHQEVADFKTFEEEAGVEVFSLHPHYPFVTESYMEIANAAGKAVYPWTVDREADLRNLIDLGVAGLITNKPGLLRTILDN
ncbi:glycerophosphodiester phosphodiesterase [Paenibacillus sp. 1011MAR3C5]|uniref:glycerophosphodiester phosphodiesterase n=1 Tax=Paenibacillus sp. 1011MAR3C5 TaxID=1675787 RepID=UPI000E6CD26C|nr:glycerophosphodiester phosphodiesterase family protein [Paenibacillus sp. 1011MAR3C5]RJE90979.1 glycerophosphodiester phosphodiesterase [Paenibacillus sp. 1011MAR3C5]